MTQNLSSMTIVEAEHLICSLKFFSIDQVGTAVWKEQRESIELLNHCSHTNAILKKDDFVMTFLIRHEKCLVILHELLVMETWRRRVFPQVVDELLSNASGTYMYCHYELILLNFLECLMFFEEIVVGFEDDILELIDYAWRQVVRYLSYGVSKINEIFEGQKITSTEDVEKISQKKQVFEPQMFQMDGIRCMTSISLLWFVTDRIGELSMAVLNNILQKNDLLMGMSDVLVAQPWMRRGKDSKIEKYIDGSFQVVDDFQRVCIPEAHTWFILHKLLCDRECRKKYNYITYRKEAILRIKRFLNETLVDQIPALVDVQRAVEELSFLQPPTGTEEKFRSALVIEQVPRFLTAIDNDKIDWSQIVDTFKRAVKDPRVKMEDSGRVSKIFDQLLNFSEK